MQKKQEMGFLPDKSIWLDLKANLNSDFFDSETTERDSDLNDTDISTPCTVFNHSRTRVDSSFSDLSSGFSPIKQSNDAAHRETFGYV